MIIWTGDIKKDIKEWIDSVGIWFNNEPMASPGYLHLFCSENEIPIAFFFEFNNETKVLCPYIKRRIFDTDYFDVISGYGYGGPFICGDNSEIDWEYVWNSILKWFEINKIVTEVIKFSIFSNHCRYPGEYKNVMNNVVVDLKNKYDYILKAYDRKVRKNLRRANEYGLKIKIDNNLDNLDEFCRIYYSTMERRDADQKFFFEKSFFNRIRDDIAGEYRLFYVYYNNKIISTELVLLSDDIIYSYLGGTDKAYYYTRANDFLKNEIILWGCNNGFSKFVLGGGHGDDDGIFNYKKSFAPDGIYGFFVGTRIINESIYLELCREYAGEHEDISYVPAYR